MVTKVQHVNSLGYMETTYYGLSSDTKPTEDVNNGDWFVEMDTAKYYTFDEEGATWYEQ